MHNTTTTPLVAGFVLTLGACCTLAAATSSVPLKLAIRDSVTGLAVEPSSLLIDGEEQRDRLTPGGRAHLAVAPGPHTVIVQAPGYRKFQARQSALEGESPLNVVLLDPLEPPPAIQPETLARLADPAHHLLSGYVVDDETGSPIEGAEIRASRPGTATLTDAAGFFRLVIPVADGIPLEGNGKWLKTNITIRRAGYAAQEWREMLASSGGSEILRIRLQRGDGAQTFDTREHRGRMLATLFDGLEPVAVEDGGAPPSVQETRAEPMALQAAPTTIRVGRNCPNKLSCATVEIMSIETYTKHVLPAEWYASWRPDSLKAGAIAIRSYGGWHVYHPLTATYDICDTSACQVYKDGTDSRTDAAIDATAGIYMVDASGNIGRAEYSAENNDLINRDGCGDCYTLNNPGDGVCLSDAACCGRSQNGHGRGMCQWGSQLWALNHSKTYDWICDHYYAAYGWTRANLLNPPPVIIQQPVPQNACPDSTAVFSVIAEGNPSLSYRWQKNEEDLSNGGHYSGVTTATLTVTPVSGADAASYRCVVSNGGGSTPSDAAALTLAVATTVTQHPQPQSVCPGDTATFSIAATGGGTLGYQWQKDTMPLAEGGHYAGVATAMLTVSSADASDVGTYRCVVTGECGPATSEGASLSLDGPALSRADFDEDGDVDQADFGHLQFCMTGPFVPQLNQSCLDACLSTDSMVDEHDFNIFLACFSGPGLPADPCCDR